MLCSWNKQGYVHCITFAVILYKMGYDLLKINTMWLFWMVNIRKLKQIVVF